MAWLAREHPVLVPRYRGLYGNGSYAPRRYQQQITDQARIHRIAESDVLETIMLTHNAVKRLVELGGQPVTIDFAPFRETAELLYSGPWVAERMAAIEPFLRSHPDSIHPVTYAITSTADRYSAVDTFRAMYRLEELRRTASAQTCRWSSAAR